MFLLQIIFFLGVKDSLIASEQLSGKVLLEICPFFFFFPKSVINFCSTRFSALCHPATAGPSLCWKATVLSLAIQEGWSKRGYPFPCIRVSGFFPWIFCLPMLVYIKSAPCEMSISVRWLPADNSRKAFSLLCLFLVNTGQKYSYNLIGEIHHE